MAYSKHRSNALLILLSAFLLAGLEAPECVAGRIRKSGGRGFRQQGYCVDGRDRDGAGAYSVRHGIGQSNRRAYDDTDAHGKFTIARLIPGWYSLKVSSPTRLPAMRNGVRVEAGETVVASFVLTDIFAPIHFQVPSHSVSSWGDDWKWILRTSSTTRPILRYRQPAQTQKASAEEKQPAPHGAARMVGIIPASAPRDPLAEDFGMASVFAYSQSLSADSDVLVAGTMEPYDSGLGSVGTLMRRNQLQGDPQQFGVTLHQFGAVPGTTPNALNLAKGLVATYSETRLIAPKVTVTAGMDINYLSAIDSVFSAQPQVTVEYQATPQTVVSAGIGSGRGDVAMSSMMERLNLLNAFPQVTQRDGHLELAQLKHAEVAVNHRMGRSARLQAAAYHDSLRNPGVWAWGNAQGFAGNALPNPAGMGLSSTAEVTNPRAFAPSLPRTSVHVWRCWGRTLPAPRSRHQAIPMMVRFGGCRRAPRL